MEDIEAAWLRRDRKFEWARAAIYRMLFKGKFDKEAAISLIVARGGLKLDSAKNLVSIWCSHRPPPLDAAGAA